MSDDVPVKDWKLKLRYGKLTTPYEHFALIAEGVAGELAEGFACRPGNAFMGMKAWASSADEAAHMVRIFAERIGFRITGNINVFDTEASEPPRANPYGYGINFTPFDV